MFFRRFEDFFRKKPIIVNEKKVVNECSEKIINGEKILKYAEQYPPASFVSSFLKKQEDEEKRNNTKTKKEPNLRLLKYDRQIRGGWRKPAIFSLKGKVVLCYK